jgi:hypothetical protein
MSLGCSPTSQKTVIVDVHDVDDDDEDDDDEDEMQRVHPSRLRPRRAYRSTRVVKVIRRQTQPCNNQESDSAKTCRNNKSV